MHKSNKEVLCIQHVGRASLNGDLTPADPAAAVPSSQRSHLITVQRGAGYQLRSLLVHQTFKKVLYISPAVRSDFSSGRVFNLVTSDAETLQLLCQNIMGLISSPLRIIVAMAMLYFELGVSSLVAFAVLLLLMPTQVPPAITCCRMPLWPLTSKNHPPPSHAAASHSDHSLQECAAYP